MTTSQVFFSCAILLVAVIYIRKLLMKRAVTHYDAASVAAKLKAGQNIILLDVRTAGERSRQQIPDSIHIPLHELKHRMREIDRVKEKEIICYCQSGNRSLSAAYTLQRHGYRVANLAGGISAWSAGT